MVTVIVKKTSFVCEWGNGQAVTYDITLSDVDYGMVVLHRDDESEFIFDVDTWPVVRDKIDEAFGLAGKSGGGCDENSR